MRFKVITRYGYASFDEADEAKARALYEQEGISIHRCDDLGDDGELLDGVVVNTDWCAA